MRYRIKHIMFPITSFSLICFWFPFIFRMLTVNWGHHDCLNEISLSKCKTRLTNLPNDQTFPHYISIYIVAEMEMWWQVTGMLSLAVPPTPRYNWPQVSGKFLAKHALLTISQLIRHHQLHIPLAAKKGLEPLAVALRDLSYGGPFQGPG